MALDLSDALKQLATVEEPARCVVRLRTTTWFDEKGLYTKRSLTFLKRKCVGWNGLEEAAHVIGSEGANRSIVNLDECKDGVYEVVVCNVSHDWESGHVDDWDFKLLPITPLSNG